jgi:hypothetical protein
MAKSNVATLDELLSELKENSEFVAAYSKEVAKIWSMGDELMNAWNYAGYIEEWTDRGDIAIMAQMIKAEIEKCIRIVIDPPYPWDEEE